MATPGAISLQVVESATGPVMKWNIRIVLVFHALTLAMFQGSCLNKMPSAEHLFLTLCLLGNFSCFFVVC